MRVLMLGNSLTFYHDMPRLLAQVLGAEVVAHTRGGAYLSEHTDTLTELGRKTMPALAREQWDYVVLQEQSFYPAQNPAAFVQDATALCQLIHQNGATPVFYATWAYQEGMDKLAETGLSYAEMAEKLRRGYHTAAQMNRALVADVGDAFTALRDTLSLYEEDSYHPSAEGSMLAAAVIARVIAEDAARHAVKR